MPIKKYKSQKYKFTETSAVHGLAGQTMDADQMLNSGCSSQLKVVTIIIVISAIIIAIIVIIVIIDIIVIIVNNIITLQQLRQLIPRMIAITIVIIIIILRFCSPLVNCPSLDEEWQDPLGVPISAILFGGRRPTGVPLVYQAVSWDHAVFMGWVVLGIEIDFP